MISGFLEIPVTVTYRASSESVPQWFGSGITDRYWPTSQIEFETNIGTVHIFNQAIRRDGKHYIEFKGNGIPKGPLAKVMG
jgi:hypothetical protein